MNKKFEDIFKEQLEDEVFTPDPNAWERLAQALDKESRPEPVILPFPIRKIAAAAAVLVAIGCATIYYINYPAKENTIQAGTHSITQKAVAGKDNNGLPAPSLPEESTIPEPKPALASINNSSGTVTFTEKQPTKTIAANSSPKSTTGQNTSYNNHPEHENNITPADLSTVQSKEMPNTSNPKKDKENPQRTTIAINKANPVITDKGNETIGFPPIAAPDWNSLNTFAQYEEKADRKSTNIGVLGGMNYGSANAGFVLGINTRVPISDKIFFDGVIAYANSNPNNSQSISQTRYGAMRAAYSPATYNRLQEPVQINALSYIQVNPSIGLHITKNTSLGLGVDIQRLLNDNSNAYNKTVVYTGNNDFHLLPNIDFGLSAKAEYAINKRLKAAMLYREGVSALVDYKYFNRRYLQMQLNWFVFGK